MRPGFSSRRFSGVALFLLVSACGTPPGKKAVTDVPPPLESQGARWELWRDWPGTSVREMAGDERLATTPTRMQWVPDLESARDVMENFGVRMSGWLFPPETGLYQLELDSRGGEALWRLDRGHGWEEAVFSPGGERAVGEIELASGSWLRYEILHKAGSGPDGLRAGWTTPSGERSIPLGAGWLGLREGAGEIGAFNARVEFLQPRLDTFDRAAGLAMHPHLPRADEHLTRETVYTAGAMLDSGDPELRETAYAALRAVLPLQEVYEKSPAYGNWPKVVERPGDFSAQNIGGFIGAELLKILYRHGDTLPADLKTETEEALRLAAIRSVRYDPPVFASNIVSKAVAVALLADQMLEIPEAGEWGRARLADLHAAVMETGTFAEYNSPTYNRVVLDALSLMRAHLTDRESRTLVEDLYRAAWSECILNTHPGLQLWTGPSTRRYHNLVVPGERLQEGTDNACFAGVASAPRIPAPLPPELLAFLEPPPAPVTRRTTVMPATGEANIISQQGPLDLVAIHHLDPSFSLGSFNRSDLWSQRAPVFAAWGRRDAPGILRLTSPSTSAGALPLQVATVQDGGRMLLWIGFATDASWGRHPYDLYGVDRTPPREIADLRLRFHSEGPARARFEVEGDTVVASLSDGLRLRIRLLDTRFGSPAVWRVLPDGGVDLDLHPGAAFQPREAGSAAAALALELESAGNPGDWLAEARVDERDGTLQLRAGDMSLSAPVAPGRFGELLNAIRFSVPEPETLETLP